MPAISVIMGVHNGRPFLPAAIASVRAQTWADWELVVVDNGSTDGSAELVRELCPADRLRLIEEPAAIGPAAALGRAVQIARGALLAVLDQDDVAAPQRLTCQAAFLAENPEIGLVAGRSRCVDRLGSPLDIEPAPALHEEIAPLTAYTHVLRHSTFMMRREALALAPYRAEFAGAGDMDLLARMVEVTRVACLPQVLADYRLHGENHSKSNEATVAVFGALARLTTRRRRLGLPEDFAGCLVRMRAIAERTGLDLGRAHAACAGLFWREGYDDLAALHAWNAWRANRHWSAPGRYAAAVLRGMLRGKGVGTSVLQGWLKEPAHQLIRAAGGPDRFQF